jgi:hypothetical protein
MTFTTQTEALDPATLADVVGRGIESRMDMDIFPQAVEREDAERAAILEWVEKTRLDG